MKEKTWNTERNQHFLGLFPASPSCVHSRRIGLQLHHRDLGDCLETFHILMMTLIKRILQRCWQRQSCLEISFGAFDPLHSHTHKKKKWIFKILSMERIKTSHIKKAKMIRKIIIFLLNLKEWRALEGIEPQSEIEFLRGSRYKTKMEIISHNWRSSAVFSQGKIFPSSYFQNQECTGQEKILGRSGPKSFNT